MSKPILFSGPMVRAILEGRKTQTRRIIKTLPNNRVKVGKIQVHALDAPCRYGGPGDQLWVRETWGTGCRPCPREGWRDGIEYRADEAYLDEHDLLPLYSVEPPDGFELDGVSTGWKPSIHMFKWMARIHLTITDIRVERLQNISEEDAVAEGVDVPRCKSCGYTYADACLQMDHNLCGEPSPEPARGVFETLWDSINSKRTPWSDNPWVWVVEFENKTPATLEESNVRG